VALSISKSLPEKIGQNGEFSRGLENTFGGFYTGVEKRKQLSVVGSQLGYNNGCAITMNTDR
jgi:hypothetical protein